MDDAPTPRDLVLSDALHPDIDSESAFRILIEKCCIDVDVWIARFLERDDPHAAKKARVAIRRMTTTLDAFRHILKRRSLASDRSKAKAIFRIIGAVRDADVYLDLRGDVAKTKDRKKAQRLREQAQGKLRKERAVGFAPAFLAKVSDGSIFRDKVRGTVARKRPLRETAAQVLQECWDGCMSYPADLATLSDRRRHDLRKALKNLRYAGEFFSPVWPSPLWPVLRRNLREAQNGLGQLNDLVVARHKDGRVDKDAEAAALACAYGAWSAVRAAPRWWDEAVVELHGIGASATAIETASNLCATITEQGKDSRRSATVRSGQF